MNQKNNPYVTNHPTEFFSAKSPIKQDLLTKPLVQAKAFDDKPFGNNVHITGYSCLPANKNKSFGFS